MLMFWLLTILVGFASGYLSGQFGVGGAVLTTPAIRLLLDYPALIAVGTPLVVILPTTLAALVQYVREQLVDWPLVARVAPGGLAGVLFGSYVTKFVPGDGIMLATAAVIVILGLQMILSRRGVAERETEPHRALPYAVGVLAGLLSGFLGVGGGIILVPAFAGPLKRGIKKAFGTSLVIVTVFALPGSLVHYALGHVNLLLAAGLSIGVVPGAWIGARVAIGAEDRLLRRAFGFFMIAVALLLAFTSIGGLLR